MLVVVDRARRSARCSRSSTRSSAPRVRWLVLAVAPAAVCYVARRRPRLVRHQLHRQAERAGARGAVHHPQHRDDAAGVRAGPHRTASVPRRRRRRGGRRGEQPGHAAEHPAVGLARAAGHAAADPGDPHLLRLPRHRHRSLRVNGIGAADDARRARAERREAAREQPQLDQREADLHARLRRHDEPGQRLHAGRAAGAHPGEHAGAEHDPVASR